MAMSHIRRSLSVFALAGALALPLRAQSLAALCRAALRVTPGQWSSYRFIGGSSDGGTMRLATVGMQRVGDAWFGPHVPFGVARALTKDGHDMVLTGSGKDAKSSITETPEEMGR